MTGILDFLLFDPSRYGGQDDGAFGLPRSLFKPRNDSEPPQGLASPSSADVPADTQASPIAVGDYMMPRIGAASAYQPYGSSGASAQGQMPQQDAGGASGLFDWDRLGRNLEVAAQNAMFTPGGPVPKAIGIGVGALTGMGTDPLSLVQYGGRFLQGNGLPLGDASGMLSSAVGGLQGFSNKLPGGIPDVTRGVADLGAGAQDLFSKLFGSFTGGTTGQSADPRSVGEPLNLLPPGIGTDAEVLNPGRTPPNNAPTNGVQFQINAPGGDANGPSAPDQGRTPQADKSFRKLSTRYEGKPQAGADKTLQAKQQQPSDGIAGAQRNTAVPSKPAAVQTPKGTRALAAPIFEPGQTIRGARRQMIQSQVTPEGAALLRIIPRSEANTGDPYTLITGGGRFSGFDDHPRKVGMVTENGPSTAAGAYQFTAQTWDESTKKYSKLFGVKNGQKIPFSPENQDRMAWLLAQDRYAVKTGRSLQDDLKDPAQHEGIFEALHPTWTSLPGGKEPNRQTKSQRAALLTEIGRIR